MSSVRVKSVRTGRRLTMSSEDESPSLRPPLARLPHVARARPSVTSPSLLGPDESENSDEDNRPALDTVEDPVVIRRPQREIHFANHLPAGSASVTAAHKGKKRTHQNNVGISTYAPGEGTKRMGSASRPDAPPAQAVADGPVPLLSNNPSVGEAEEYGEDERQLNEFLKLHPMYVQVPLLYRVPRVTGAVHARRTQVFTRLHIRARAAARAGPL